jgi:hypothetical protein
MVECRLFGFQLKKSFGGILFRALVFGAVIGISFHWEWAQQSFDKWGWVNGSWALNITVLDLFKDAIARKHIVIGSQNCTRPAGFGFGDEPACFGNVSVKTIRVRAPNCNETCAGIKYSNDVQNASYTIEVFTDDSFQKVHESDANCRLALLWEPPAIRPRMYQEFMVDKKDIMSYILHPFFTYKNYSTAFHKVLTTSDTLIFSNRSKFTRYLASDSWVRTHPLLSSDTLQGKILGEDLLNQAIQAKTKGISMILSVKDSAPGHRMRHTIWSGLFEVGIQSYYVGQPNLVYGCGWGAGNPVSNKTQCLEQFRFSIVIENDRDQGYYFSEKLVDCFVLATVPIMWGTGEHLVKLFDARGFIFWQTPEDLHRILRELDTREKQEKEYMKRIEAIKCNYRSALQFTTQLFDRLAQYLVGPNGGPNCNVCPCVVSCN